MQSVHSPAHFFISGNSRIAKFDSRDAQGPGNDTTHGPVAVPMLSHGDGCWSVRHATCYDWWQALPTIVPSVYHAYQIKQTIKIQFWYSVGEVHVIIRLSF